LSHAKQIVLTIEANQEPKTYEEAYKYPQCRKLMDEEIKALENNNTWIIFILPQNKTTIGCRWIYKIKRKIDASFYIYKARLVANGYI